VTANYCCQTAGSGSGAAKVDTCKPAGALGAHDVEDSCSGGTTVNCLSAANCINSQICCLNAVSATPATAVLSCQTELAGDAGPCPPGVGLASAQFCVTDAECKSGSCAIWSCSATTPPTIFQTCAKPTGILGGTCALVTGSGSGSGS
jgi:hypothetical protein